MRFLLVDRIEELEPGVRARGWKNAAMSEDYFEWHFPERPIVPGMLILEAFAQLAGWLEAAGSDFQSWLLLDRVKAARYYAFASPGDRIDLELTCVASDEPGRRIFRGESRVGEERGAVVEFEGVIVPLADFESAERARQTYSALRREMPGDQGGRRG
jgi:3-hydroxyacyl-[acyl-carrier-protein] dehydratase